MGGEQDLLQKENSVYCLANSNCTVPIVAFVQKTVSQIKSQLLRLEKRQKRRPSPHRANQIEKVRRQLFTKSTAKTLNTPPQVTLAVPTELELDSPLNLTPQSNKREALFAAKATTAGWAVTHNGWPDFLCWRGDQIAFVEVKPDGQELRYHQAIVMHRLVSLGLPCYVWSPKRGLKKLSLGSLDSVIRTRCKEGKRR